MKYSGKVVIIVSTENDFSVKSVEVGKRKSRMLFKEWVWTQILVKRKCKYKRGMM